MTPAEIERLEELKRKSDASDDHATRMYIDSLIDHAPALLAAAKRVRELEQAVKPLASNMLLSMMQEISEEHYCAGWLSGLEYSLWSLVLTKGGDFGMKPLGADDAAELHRLAVLAGVWWTFNSALDGRPDHIAIPLDEWEKDYEVNRGDLPSSSLPAKGANRAKLQEQQENDE